MADVKFTKHNDKIHHPSERCEGSRATGACPNNKSHGTDFCMLHGANKQVIVLKEETKRTYRLNRWQKRMGELADDNQIKSLREEIGILRIVMEEIVNSCDDAMDLLMKSHRICDVAMKIEKLVVSCDKLEKSMGTLLSKRAILQLAGEWSQVIESHVTDADTLESISEGMLLSLKKIEAHVVSE